LPRRAGERRGRLEALAGDPRTVVVFESPKRLAATLEEVREVLGDRRAAVARELTKLHEEVLRGSVGEILGRLGEVRGEVVVVIEGAPDGPSDPDAARAEAAALVAGGMRRREAAAAAG